MAGAAQTSHAKVTIEKLSPVRSTTSSAVFNVRSLRSKVVTSAKVAVGRSYAPVSKRRLRRATRTGILRISFAPSRGRTARHTASLSRKKAVRLEITTRAKKEKSPSARTVRPVRPGPQQPTPPSGSTKRDDDAPETPAPPPGDPAPAPGIPTPDPDVPDPSSGTPDPSPEGPIPGPPSEPAAPSAERVGITGRTYYVSPSGSDSNSGLSPNSAWRTVAKVNRSALDPGDGVLFEGGSTFADDTLMPPRSGTVDKHIVYGAYGDGRASLPKGIWIRDSHWLAFQDFEITGASQGIVASAGGSGSSNIEIRGTAISNVGIGINAANAGDRYWRLVGNTIARTQDSGVIVLGSGHFISGNAISENALDRSTSHGKHGIYLKAADSTVVGNSIRDFGDSGVSVRYRNSRIEGNTIIAGGHAIAWHQYDTTAGTSYWRNNVIRATTAAGIYVSPNDVGGNTRESFHISGNDISVSRGHVFDLRATIGTYVVADNIVR